MNTVTNSEIKETATGLLQAEVLLRNLYQLCKSGEKFSLNDVIRMNGYKDCRLIDFLQDVNILRNSGSKGRHSKWHWNTNVTPSEKMAKAFVSRWDIYRFNLSKVADKNPKVLTHFPELTEVKGLDFDLNTANEFIDMHQKLNELLAFQQIQNKIWMEKTDSILAKQNYELECMNMKLFGMSNRLKSLRESLVDQTLSVPFFFKLFKIKISFNN
jgi:hypothetical protein